MVGIFKILGLKRLHKTSIPKIQNYENQILFVTFLKWKPDQNTLNTIYLTVNVYVSTLKF